MMVEEAGLTAASNCCTKRNAADAELESLVHIATTTISSPVFQDPPLQSHQYLDPPSQSHQDPPPPSTSVSTKKDLEETLLQESITSTAAVPDLIITTPKGVNRSRKKSEEGRSTPRGQGQPLEGGSKKSSCSGKNRKQRSIPVGIAVAWQRHVTTSATASLTNSSSYTTKKHLQNPTSTASPTMSSPPPKRKRSPGSPKVSLATVSAGSPPVQVKNGHEGHCHKVREGHVHETKHGGMAHAHAAGGAKSPSPHARVPVPVTCSPVKKLSNSDNNGKDAEHIHAFRSDIGGVGGQGHGGAGGHGQGHGGVGDKMKTPPVLKSSNSFYATTPYGYSNPYGDWTSQYFVPNSSQQSYNTMMAAYIQQLSMHNSPPTSSVPYGYNSLSSPYLYPSTPDTSGTYTPEQMHQYDRLLLQRQQEQFERSQVEQQRRILAAADFDLRHVSTPIPNLSPRISIPSPSPNSPQGQGGPFGGNGPGGPAPFPAHQASTTPTVPWMTSDLYHHHHPMTLISSATLSPRSLASSTPSPITTYESLNHSYLYNRKCITPIPPLKHFPTLFSPPLYPKDAGPVSLVTHSRTVSPSPSPVRGAVGGLDTDPLPEPVESVEIPAVGTEEVEGKESIVVKPEKTSVDFTRLESLIEKRGEDGRLVVAHAPPFKRGEKRKGSDESRDVETAPCKRRHHHHHRDCNGNETLIKHHCNGNEIEVPEPTVVRDGMSSKSIKKENSTESAVCQRKSEDEKYFLPIRSTVDDELSIYGLEEGEDVRTEPDDRRLSTTPHLHHDSVSAGPNPESSSTSVSHSHLPGLTDNIQSTPCDKSVSGFLCDNGTVGAISNWPLVSNTGAGGSNNSGSVTFSNSGSGHTGNFSNFSSTFSSKVGKTASSSPPPFPKIVIPSGENHLNLLATVAQEIGPYISLLPNQSSTSPRRFEGVDLEQLITIESWRSDTSPKNVGICKSETKVDQRQEPIKSDFTKSIKDEEADEELEDAESRILPTFDHAESKILPTSENAESRILPKIEETESRILPKIEEAESRILPMVKDSEHRIVPEFEHGEKRDLPTFEAKSESKGLKDSIILKPNTEPFQLKIPQIVPRVEKVKGKVKVKVKRGADGDGESGRRERKEKKKRDSKLLESVGKSSLPERKLKQKRLKIEKEGKGKVGKEKVKGHKTKTTTNVAVHLLPSQPRSSACDASKCEALPDGPKTSKLSDGPKTIKLSDGPKTSKLSDGAKKIKFSDGPKKIEISDSLKNTPKSPKKIKLSDSPKKIKLSDSPKKIKVSDSPKRIKLSDSPKKIKLSDSPKKIKLSNDPRKTNVPDNVKKINLSDSSRKPISSPSRTTTSDSPQRTDGPKVINSFSEVKKLESIYDFEVEDVDILPPEFETFKHFSSVESSSDGSETKRPNKQFSMLSHLYASTKKSYAGSPASKSKDLKKPRNKSPVSPYNKNTKIVTKGHDPTISSISSRATKKLKMLRRSNSVNGIETNMRPTLTAEDDMPNLTLEDNRPMVTLSEDKRSNLTLAEEGKKKGPFLSANLNTDSNGTDFSTDSGSSTWTANPTLAVKAIKLPPVKNLKKVKEVKSVKKVGSKKNGHLAGVTPRSRSPGPSRSLTPEVKRDVGDEEPKKGKLCVSNLSGESLNPIWKKSIFPLSPRGKRGSSTSTSAHHIKPCLKAEPIRTKTIVEEDQAIDDELFLNLNGTGAETEKIELSPLPTCEKNEKGPKLKIRKPSIDMNIFSRKVKSSEEEKVTEEEALGNDWPEKVVIGGVEEMIDEMRVLTEIEGLFYTGKLNALQPPDVYGVTLDNERGAPPHMIFSAEEVLEKCIREAKPWKPSQLPHGLRICAYWSAMYSGLYPGHVSTDYDLTSDLVPVQFDDGDTGVIKICEIRLLAPDHPVREYDPNPLLTLEKKHRKRRHSSAGGAGGECTGEHEEDDCGEAYCAKIAKLQEAEGEEEDFPSPSSNRFTYWTWTGLGVKQGKTKQNRHKEFFQGIQRGDEVINVGDSAIFISEQQNRRPFLGKIENFWEKKGLKSVTVRWFYHPEEAKTNRKMPALKYPGAVFESPHTDDNDVQTIAKKCEVLSLKDFKAKYGSLFTGPSGGKTGKLTKAAAATLKGVYYLAGHYDPYARSLKMTDLK